MAVNGAVDGVVGRFVVGWAHDPDDSGRRVELEVELDGRFVASGVADLDRGDLRTARIGDGRHAFRIELPHALEPGTEYVLAVRTPDGRASLPLASDCVVELEPGISGPPAVLRPESSYSAAAPASDDWLLGERVVTPQALLGTDGWLFEPHEARVMDWMLGLAEFPGDAVGRIRDRLVRRHTTLLELGVTYVPVVIPDKATLYPERLPLEMRGREWPRPVETVAAILADENAVDLIDPLPLLRHRREAELLYPRTGSQLTWRGAFHIYRTAAKELAKRLPAIQPLGVDDFRPGVAVPVQPNLIHREHVIPVGGETMVVLTEMSELETEPDLNPGVLSAMYVPVSREIELRAGRGVSLLARGDAQLQAPAIIVHDGRGGRVASLLAEHFPSALVVPSDEPPYPCVGLIGAALVVHLISEAALAEEGDRSSPADKRP